MDLNHLFSRSYIQIHWVLFCLTKTLILPRFLNQTLIDKIWQKIDYSSDWNLGLMEPRSLGAFGAFGTSEPRNLGASEPRSLGALESQSLWALEIRIILIRGTLVGGKWCSVLFNVIILQRTLPLLDIIMLEAAFCQVYWLSNDLTSKKDSSDTSCVPFTLFRFLSFLVMPPKGSSKSHITRLFQDLEHF